ncbi:MAG: hypothetical protein FWD78_02785 [Treponema sp.]|nr:hypothetical protein [Treponema sp.]
MSKKIINNSLVILIIVLSLFASAYGFFSNDVVYGNREVKTINGDTVLLYGKGLYYNDSVSYASQARAQDIITLIVGIPLLIVSLYFSNKNSIRGKLLLTGTIGYFLYSYTSYTFLVTYNKFFLIYTALMSLSFFCFIINFSSPEFKDLKKYFKQNFPKKYIGIFLFIIGIIICSMWLGLIIPSIKKAPVVLDHYTTFVIQAMDLGFIVPVSILSGVLLIKNKSLGYLLASLVIIKGTTLLLAVTMMIIFMISTGVNVPMQEIIVFPLFAILCILNLFILLKSIVNTKA